MAACLLEAPEGHALAVDDAVGQRLGQALLVLLPGRAPSGPPAPRERSRQGVPITVVPKGGWRGPETSPPSFLVVSHSRVRGLSATRSPSRATHLHPPPLLLCLRPVVIIGHVRCLVPRPIQHVLQPPDLLPLQQDLVLQLLQGWNGGDLGVLSSAGLSTIPWVSGSGASSTQERLGVGSLCP